MRHQHADDRDKRRPDQGAGETPVVDHRKSSRGSGYCGDYGCYAGMIHRLPTSQVLESFYSVRLAERAAGSGDFGALSTAAVGIGGSPRPRAAAFSLDPVVDVMAALRSPGGCVWDLEQNHRSLRRYIVEEVYEVLEAIDLADGDKLCEELGDLLLQIVFHARIAEEAGEFSMQDVVDTVTEKMVRRHPHVFGEVSVRDAAEVIVNWEKIKRREHPGERPSVLDGVPKELPALMRAYKLQAKAAKVGFDWNSAAPVWDKIYEELAELREAAAGGDAAAIEGELGDVLFSVVNLARFFDTEPETALNVTNNKFVRRFAYIEAKVKEQGLKWKDLSLMELDALWNEAKVPKNEEK
jgi:tetrapyrrole methylase family protein/MazG family protein